MNDRRCGGTNSAQSMRSELPCRMCALLASQRDAQNGFAEGLAGFDVHLVVGKPQRHLGDLGRELFDFDAEELIHVHAQEGEDLADPLAEGGGGAQDIQFQSSQLAVGHHQKIAAATGRIEKRQSLQLLVKFEQLVLVALDHLELGAQFVEKQRPNQAQDVRFARVMRTQFTATGLGVQVHHLLEHGAEDRRGDRAPGQAAQAQQLAAHRRVERWHGQVFFEQAPVHIGEVCSTSQGTRGGFCALCFDLTGASTYNFHRSWLQSTDSRWRSFSI